MTYPFKIKLTRIELNLTQIEINPKIKPTLPFLHLHRRNTITVTYQDERDKYIT